MISEGAARYSYLPSQFNIRHTARLAEDTPAHKLCNARSIHYSVSLLIEAGDVSQVVLEADGLTSYVWSTTTHDTSSSTC